MTNSESPHLSVVIPAYNEERRIGPTLDAMKAYLDARDYAYEIIVVDDGSGDATSAIVREQYPGVRLITCPGNKGKGYAVKQGMLAADGAYRLFYDADSSTPIEELEKVWPLMEAGAAIVIGSRALPDSNVEVRQPWYRQNMGRIYNLLLRSLFLTEYPDTQCGFKVLTAGATETVFPRETMNGYGSDCEVLCIARVHGLPVAQIPVRWLNSPDTRVHAFFDSLDMIREVLIIRWNLFRGRYR